MRIRVCIPFYADFETAKPGLLELMACTEHEFIIEPRQGTYIGKTRNHLINDGKSSEIHQKPIEGFDAFLTVDSDIEFILNDVLIMIAHDKDIVGLPYLIHNSKTMYECVRFSNAPRNIKTRCDTSDKGLKSIISMGAGMMLIKSAVFSNMEYPWYRHQMVVIGTEQDETAEDIGFCMGAKKAGYKIWCDFDNPVGHKQRTVHDFDWEIA